ncbi:MAG: YciI family protein [Candidatus Binatia bacterium]
MSEVTHYLYRIQPSRLAMLTDGPTSEEAAIVAQHFAYLQELTERGIVVLAGRTLTTDERSFGIVIFRADSAEAARIVMEQDPAVQHGVMRAELYPYRIALMAKTEKMLGKDRPGRERGRVWGETVSIRLFMQMNRV